MEETLLKATKQNEPDRVCGQVERWVIPPVLDVCCGSKMFWFNPKDERTLFIDIRKDEKAMDLGTPNTKGRKPKVIAPDEIADFRNLPFRDETFSHVVFDPPHLYKSAGNGIIAFKYGVLNDSWKDDLKKRF